MYYSPFYNVVATFFTQKRQMELAAESAKYNNNNSNNNRSFTGANTITGDDAVIMDHSGMEDALHGTLFLFCFVSTILFVTEEKGDKMRRSVLHINFVDTSF